MHPFMEGCKVSSPPPIRPCARLTKNQPMRFTFQLPLFYIISLKVHVVSTCENVQTWMLLTWMDSEV